MSSRTLSSSSRRRPRARAAILRVMSSSVGPRPPVRTTTPERLSASRMGSSRAALSAPPRGYLARDVGLGGSGAAREDDDAGALERVADGLFETRVVVADDGLELDLDAGRVEPVGQPEAIGVRAKGRQQLGADGDDLCG